MSIWNFYLKLFQTVFELEFYANILGMIELNGIEAVIDHPLSIYFDNFSENPTQNQKKPSRALRDIQERLWEFDDSPEKVTTDDYEYQFPPASGSGIFKAIAMINHSCDPNTFLFKKGVFKDSACSIYSKKPIKKDRQLFISYIQEDELDVEERREMLSRPYLFDCDCFRCSTELKSK